MFKTEQLSGKQQLENLDYQPNHRLQRKPKKDFYENQTLNRQDRRNQRNIEVPWFRFNNGYVRKTQEHLLKKLTASGFEHLDKIIPDKLEDYKKLCKEIHYNKDINLYLDNCVENWDKDFLDSVHFIGNDTKSFLSLSQPASYVILLNMVYSDENAEHSGRSIINYLLNLCDKYQFHLKLHAVPLQTRREFNRDWLKTENRIGREHKNPLLRSKSHKTHLGMVKGLEGLEQYKGLDSMYKLYDYYSSFGMVPTPNPHLVHFLPIGFNSLMHIEMLLPHPKLEFNKITYPWYEDMQLSQVGSVKRTFTYQESMNYTKWILDNRRLDLLTRNLDVYKLLLSVDTAMTMEYENSKNDKDRDNIGHFVEMDYQTNKPLNQMKTSEFYEKYRTPEKVSIYSQTIISTCVDMINGKRSPNDGKHNPKDLVNRLFGDKRVEFNLSFNGLKDCKTEEDTWKYRVNYPDFINRVK